MPVPTDTFRNIKILNLIFAVSAMLLLVATGWMVLADHHREWHHFQKDANLWQEAMTRDAMNQAITDDWERNLKQTLLQSQSIEESLPSDTIQNLKQNIAKLTGQIERARLPATVWKGKRTPSIQQYERALAEFGPDHPETKNRLQQTNEIEDEYQERTKALVNDESKLEKFSKELAQLLEQKLAQEKRLAELQRQADNFESNLATLKPTGVAKIGDLLRNAALLDWANASLRVQEVYLPDVLTDYNFMTVETVDRCQSCHFNIDKPAFDRLAQIAFVERQVARGEGQSVDTVDRPVTMLPFWVAAVRSIDELDQPLREINKITMAAINALYEAAEDGPQLDATEQLPQILERIEAIQGNDKVARSRWYKVREYYLRDLQKLLAKHLGKTAYGRLLEYYRVRLIDRYNEQRRDDPRGLRPLSTSPALLAHPRLALYVGPDSAHPMQSMGCSVCHEGSGQETQFEHTTHEPRDMWVDAKTGAAVPRFLLTGEIGEPDDIRSFVRQSSESEPAAGHRSAKANSHTHHKAHHYTHDDINLNNPDYNSGSPFAPTTEPQRHVASAFLQPGRATPGVAVRQADFWKKKFGWYRKKFMYWEKPMHALDYIESSCTRCHTEVFDIKDDAPVLFEGRRLFSQFGCINCHAVSALEDDLDIKRVGPSLVHVKDKLSRDMLATWIWAPKSFRPTTRMPHYFMLENNSSPIDILRTRVEVLALSHYLKHASPNRSFYEDGQEPIPSYEPDDPPTETGDPDRGKLIFRNVGCLACHSNLAETGQPWIVGHMVERGLDEAEANTAYEGMTYNQQHWYILTHLEHKLERTGPELSGVASKLKAGRTPEQARTWLYNWLRQPQHYSSYTVMPSFRLSPDEANDLTAYLLTLERPLGANNDQAYTPGDFGLESLGESGKNMLRELVANLESSKVTIGIARKNVNTQPEYDSNEKLLMKLGQKMITHYGCNGCHLINGFEQAVSACTNLDDWGLKDPHKIAFEYFDHTFDHIREDTIDVWKAKHEGLASTSPNVSTTPLDGEGDINRISINWEHMDLERRPWLYHKLHNTRLFDRGRRTLNPRFADPTTKTTRQMTSDDIFDVDNGTSVGKPYDKLKMPKFFFSDRQVKALVAFVTSIRKPLVNKTMQKVVDDAGLRVARGRQLATRFNCYGCHNIEGNEVNIQQYFHVRQEPGEYHDNALNWSPPRLIGQGSKTQPDWLHHFLQNVTPIRPWLKIRMPSFPLLSVDANHLVGYLAGATQILTTQLKDELKLIDDFIDQYAYDNPGASEEQSRWYTASAIAEQVDFVKQFAIKADLATANDLDPRQTDPEDLVFNWTNLRRDVRVLAQSFKTEYPFVEKHKPRISEERLRRGEMLFAQMGCMAGQCHRMGDEVVLTQAGFLTPPDPFGQGHLEEEEEDDGYGGEYEDEEEEYSDDDTGYDEDDEESVASEIFTITPEQLADGAPNLLITAARLQPRWVRQWLQFSQRMQPGTRMQEFWVDGKSQFEAYADDKRKELELELGHTVDEQVELMMDFLYTAGPLRMTYDPEGQRIGPGSQAGAEQPEGQ